MGSSSGSDVEAGFAKLQGEDFEYYMQTYSIILGRNSKKSTVDVDLSSLGGGMNISRHHARIYYDFQRRRFALEVLGKNGCLVEGVLHLPGNPPIKLDSQDLLQIGDKEFYFLLPVRSILGGPRQQHVGKYPGSGQAGVAAHLLEAAAGNVGPTGYGGGAHIRERREYYEEEYDDDDNGGSVGKKMRKGEGYGYGSCGSSGKASISGQLDKKMDGRLRADRDADNQQLLLLEEKDVVSSVANVLSDLCGPGEWMPMEKLHAELVEHYGDTWHHSRVRRYLTSEDYPSPEAKMKPWYGLLMLLRKYPEHFVINTRSKGNTWSFRWCEHDKIVEVRASCATTTVLKMDIISEPKLLSVYFPVNHFSNSRSVNEQNKLKDSSVTDKGSHKCCELTFWKIDLPQ